MSDARTLHQDQSAGFKSADVALDVGKLELRW